MLSLMKSERFQKDYKELNARVSAITNENVKADAIKLLNQLVHEVKGLDAQHMNMVAGSAMPSIGEDSRTNIQEIRKKLISKLDDYDRSIAS